MNRLQVGGVIDELAKTLRGVKANNKRGQTWNQFLTEVHDTSSPVTRDMHIYMVVTRRWG